MSNPKSPRVIGFMLVPHFSMMAFTSAIEPLRLANRASSASLYEWRLYSNDGEPVAASNGIRIGVDGAVADARDLDVAFVCAGVDVQAPNHRVLMSALRRLASFGSAVGALCTGTYVLAKAGLLGGYRATIHWENLPSLQAEFPDLDVGQELFEIDRNRFTCAGGTSAADMMLSLIMRDHGREIASEVTEQLIHHRIREPSERQRMDLRTRLGVAHPKLIKVVAAMEQAIESPLSSHELAEGVDLSPRQLERLFLKHLGSPPTRYYLKLRLERSRQLLRQTGQPVLTVAMSCGFASASHFSKSYAEHFGAPPSAERKPVATTG